MTSVERSILYALSAEIAVENNRERFTNLASEMNALLEDHLRIMDREARIDTRREKKDSVVGL